VSMVEGEPGRWSDFRLSDDDRLRRPRNLRTERGRLGIVGLVGERVLLASSFVVVRSSSPFGDFGDVEPSPGTWCESRGPLPGVGGRGVSGGESGGAGIDVPSVREKFMGVRVRGWYLPVMLGRRLYYGGEVNGLNSAWKG
jgi:hypothetical protein